MASSLGRKRESRGKSLCQPLASKGGWAGEGLGKYLACLQLVKKRKTYKKIVSDPMKKRNAL